MQAPHHPPGPPPPLRIAHVVYGLGVGGLETGLIHLVSRLDPALFQHRVYCMKVLGPNAARAEAAGCRVERVGDPDGASRLIVARLARRFRDFRPHIVHTRNFGTLDGVLAARLAGTGAVVHGEHGWDTQDLSGRNLKRRLKRGVLSPLVSRFVAVSEDIGRWFERQPGRFRGKVVTIHNGVDLERFAGIDRAAQEAGSLVFGTVGRLDPVKDQVGLISGFELLAAGHPHARLVIWGAGPLHDRLAERRAASACPDRITLAGPTDDVVRAYSGMDVFVLPSLNEGISNTILEAMAAGLPVVASDVGGNPELVVSGETGTLVPALDAARLAQALARYAAEPDLARRQGEAGRVRARAEFSLSRMVRQYAELYLDLARRRHPALPARYPA